jgi:hypothetical protein
MLSRWNTQYVSGISDSPMWKRGNSSRSNSHTRTPRWASRVETVLPAGPPPMTTTSTSICELRRGESQRLRLSASSKACDPRGIIATRGAATRGTTSAGRAAGAATITAAKLAPVRRTTRRPSASGLAQGGIRGEVTRRCGRLHACRFGIDTCRAIVLEIRCSFGQLLSRRIYRRPPLIDNEPRRGARAHPDGDSRRAPVFCRRWVEVAEAVLRIVGRMPLTVIIRASISLAPDCVLDRCAAGKNKSIE